MDEECIRVFCEELVLGNSKLQDEVEGFVEDFTTQEELGSMEFRIFKFKVPS